MFFNAKKINGLSADRAGHQTMKKKTTTEEMVKYHEDFTRPYYVGEIVTDVVRRKLYKTKEMNYREAPVTQMGMGKIEVKSNMGKYLVDYLNNATIHGLNHLPAPRRHFIERILAIMFIGTGLGCLIALSLISWNRYQNEPTAIVLQHDYKNFNITKPAITICPMNRINEKKFPEVFMKYGVKDTQAAREFFSFISKASYKNMTMTPLYNEVPPEKWLLILWDLFLDFETRRLNVKLESTRIITEKGICRSFFSTVSEYVTIQYWLSNNWTVLQETDSMPSYTFDSRGDRLTLSVDGVGFEFSTHHPGELSEVKDMWYNAFTSIMSDVKVSIEQVDSSDNVRSLSVPQRHCKFVDDGGLLMWPVYTQKMCILECRYNLIKQHCGCYPHFARSMPGVPVCNSEQLRCIGQYVDQIQSLRKTDRMKCACLPNCKTTKYIKIAHTSTVFPEKSLLMRTMNIDILFPYDTFRREEFFGYNEFLASVGGAAGLCLGASIISFVEMFYYATLRLFWYGVKLRQEGKKINQST